MMARVASWIFLAAGLLIALLGMGLDVVLPGSEPGLGLPQILVIAGGAGLTIFGWLLRSDKFRRPLGRNLRTNLAKTAIISLVTLLALEIILIQLNTGVYFAADLPPFDGELLDWFTCDDEGCRYDYAKTVASCAEGRVTGRDCAVNQAGYRDDDEFVRPPDDIARRVMLVGDSFTQGLAADLGKSFAEYLDAELADTLVWNTGIAGSSTRDAAAAYNVFAPLLQPQLTILGFYAANDFFDNQYPVGSWLHVYRGTGQRRIVRRYMLDRWSNPVRLSTDKVTHFHARRREAPVNDLEWALGSTRLGTLLLRGLDGLAGAITADEFSRQTTLTRSAIADLLESATARNSELLVMIIPHRDKLDIASQERAAITDILQSLRIAYLDSTDSLHFSDYYAAGEGHPHWINSGHRIVGELLAECIEAFFAAGSLAACDSVIIP